MLCKGFTIPNFNPKKDNFFVMLHVHVQNSLQKVFKLLKKTLHTSIISESIQFLFKEVLKGDN